MDLLPSVEIVRLEENAEFGTFGALKINKELFCFTLEPPDNVNQTGISSIPAQQYICELHQSPKFGETFIVRDVPLRSFILFHKGNWVTDTSGCIILGSSLLKLRNEAAKRGVGNSGATFGEFMVVLRPYLKFKLTIINQL